MAIATANIENTTIFLLVVMILPLSLSKKEVSLFEYS